VLTIASLVIIGALAIAAIVGTGGGALFVIGAAVSVAGAGVAAAGFAVDAARVRRGELNDGELGWDALDVAVSSFFAFGAVKAGVKVVKLVRATRSAPWRHRYVDYGPSGRRPTPLDTAKDLRDEAIQWLAGHAEPEDDPQRQRGAVCRPEPVWPAASPLALIRHTRPIRVRPEALAGAAS
jgi:hypothetical protein